MAPRSAFACSSKDARGRVEHHLKASLWIGYEHAPPIREVMATASSIDGRDAIGRELREQCFEIGDGFGTIDAAEPTAEHQSPDPDSHEQAHRSPSLVLPMVRRAVARDCCRPRVVSGHQRGHRPVRQLAAHRLRRRHGDRTVEVSDHNQAKSDEPLRKVGASIPGNNGSSGRDKIVARGDPSSD